MTTSDKHVFELHHVIEQNKAVDASELLQELKRLNVYDIDSPRNTIYLPAEPPLAATLEISPHSGGPLGAYSRGLIQQLNKIEASTDGQALLDGDERAIPRVLAKVHSLEDTLKAGLINGDLFTNTPENMTRQQANRVIENFYDNVEQYKIDHAPQINSLGKLSKAEAQWSGVVQSERNVVATTDAVNQPGSKPAKGLPGEGHATLREAINQAHRAGRLSVSEENAATLRAAFAPHIEADLAAAERSTARTIGRGAAIKAVVGAGMVAGVVDAAEAGERTARSLAQDNPLAAQSQMAHYAGVGVGGWVGGAASGLAAGSWTGPGALAFIAVGAVSGSYVGEKAAKMWDDHKVFNQTDRDNVDWKFNGRQWVRDQPADLRDDGANKPVEQEFSALPDKARELSYRASNVATALAIGNVDPPRDPYTLRATRSDTPSLQRADWERNPETGDWNRNVVVGFEQRGVPMTRPESATPERAAELNATSEQVIRDNIASGPAPIAARYELAYSSAGWASFGEKLPAVNAALNADTLTASDGNQYRHNEKGQWQREGSPGAIAQGNLRFELDNTRAVLEPQLAQHKQQTATIPQWQPPTREEQDRDNLISTYHAFGVKPDPEHLAAALEAVERTRDAQGIDRATSSLSLEPDAQGKYDVNSPITHLRADSAGVVRIAAVTSRDEIALAMVDLRAPPPLIPDTPELRIAALSPQQREAHEQALREANREGLSHDQVQQVVQHAAVQAASPDTVRAEAKPIDAQPTRTQGPSVTLSDAAPERERAFVATPQTVAAAPAAELIPEPREPEPAPQPEPRKHAEPQAPPPLEAPQTRSEPASPTAPDATSTPPSAEAPAHVQDDTLRPGSQGQDVELLQYRLQRIGVRGPDGETLARTGQYDAATEQAVRTFQRGQGMPETGIADPTTQQAAAAAQNAQIRQAKDAAAETAAPAPEPSQNAQRPQTLSAAEQPVPVAPVPGEAPPRVNQEHRPLATADVELAHPEPAPSRVTAQPPVTAPPREPFPTDEPKQRQEHAVTAHTREPAPEPFAAPTDHARGVAGTPSHSAGNNEDHTRGTSQHATNTGPQPAFDRSQIASRDQPMFDKIRNGAPSYVSDETVALAMLEAKRNGIPDVERTGPVGVANGQLWVGSVTPGYKAGVPENGPTPPIQDTLRETQVVNQQYDQQQQRQAQERELAEQNQKQTDAMRPQL